MCNNSSLTYFCDILCLELGMIEYLTFILYCKKQKNGEYNILNTLSLKFKDNVPASFVQTVPLFIIFLKIFRHTLKFN